MPHELSKTTGKAGPDVLVGNRSLSVCSMVFRLQPPTARLGTRQ